MIAVLDGVGFLACLIGVFFTLKARSVLSPDGRIVLLGLLGTVALVQGLDVVEWTIYEPADRLGDIFKVLTPAVWLFFLFVVRRDGLLNRVAEQEQHLEFFFAHAPIAVVIVDRAGRVVACSQHWVALHQLNRSPVGELLADLTSAADRLTPGAVWPLVWSEIVQASLKKCAPRKGVHHFTEGSEPAWVEWHVRPWSHNNEVSGAILMVDAITERIERQRERERNQAKLLKGQALETVGEIATGVAHDVNNLLQVISAHAELLSFDDGSPEEITDSLRSILQAVGAASGMTRWLLAFGRQDSVTYREVELVALIKKISKLLESALPPEQSLEQILPVAPLMITADETLLEQLIINLVLNARDATQHGGKIVIQLEEVSGQRMLKVSDEGTGIDASIRDRILEPFFTTKGDQGTGMGLAVVRRAIAAHGAELKLTSQLGEGSCFAVCFPHPDIFSPPPDFYAVCNESFLIIGGLRSPHH